MAKAGHQPPPTKSRQAIPDEPRRPGRPTGRRRRKNVMIDEQLLERAVTLLGAKDQSEAIETALLRATEDADILRGLRSLRGAFPGHPDHGTGP